MSPFTVSCLSVLLLLAGPCGKAPATQEGPWSLQLTTSGGFAGRGAGNLSVDSEGKFRYEDSFSNPAVRKGCEGTLYPRQLKPISDAVANTNPKEWNRPGLDIAAPDAFGYKLELRMGSDPPIKVQWYDNTMDQLPADLKRLSDVLMYRLKIACRSDGPP